MASSLSMRLQVLSIFKKLHRVRQTTFAGDREALSAARQKINLEFQNRKNLSDPNEIEKSIKMAAEAEIVLRTTVVQAELQDPDEQIYKVKVTPETLRNENAKLKVGDVPGNIRDS